MKFGIGQPVRRTEDIRFVTGHGRYTDDLHFPSEAHAAFVRSPYAHARIRSIDATQARSAPGVVAVLTYADVEAVGAGPMPCLAPIGGAKPSPKPLLAKDKVTFVGEAVAMVIAETYAQAVDAAELVAVEYETLEAAGTLQSAPKAAAIWECASGNLCFDWNAGDEKVCAEAFANASHRVSLEVVQNRVVANPLETRNATGIYDTKTDKYTLYTTSQGAGNVREMMAGLVLKTAPEKIRVVTPDVGGGFGMKGFLYPEQPLVLIAAKALGRPVRWTSDRTEAFLSDDHGRDMRTRGELALDSKGRILALRITGTANMGGYLSQYAPFIPTLAGGRIFGGIYRVPAVHARVRGFFSNSAPVDAYRGAGRPEAAYLMERLMDVAAAQTGIDRVELRRRNLPAPSELPYKNWSGVAFDSGDYPHLLEKAVKSADVAGFGVRREQSRARGKLRGLGLSYYVEITFSVGNEPAAVKFADDGTVEVRVGTQSNGQGHETAFAQLVGERLGVPFESVTVKQGDTDWVNGGGTAGSRSLNMAGGALMQASDEVIRKGKAAAAHLLQAGSEAVAFDVIDGVGRFSVGARSIGVAELALTLKRDRITGFENGLDSDATYTGKASTFPNGCHICEAEVDPETGKVDVVSYRVLDDFGRVINPMLVRGQVQGGVAQGLGQALLENCVYDPESGQLLTASFADYAMPRAEDVPDIEFAYEEVLCKTNELGAKGCGEAGTVGALPAVTSAVCDAIGVAHIDMPATPERVWRAL
ncbi:MAG: xanthine dehydrogenase family protein molybdopterin-binding subunit [Alphaproteobacteria bacterium]|nr:xanthine dehydrogenase family protein molybdopterin-binding subunit [Alphaproteobacteria bacterium]MDE2630447.1 xanthine dehydrogenase family protein molybdopterin-binding subunit [Alphaproteobacteria bacterium]